MPLLCGTHSGGFHADDVLALALIREFVDPAATVVRTRDLAVLGRCEVVFDVGGEFDPARGRFDHHQSSYTGELSSAGMVLEWIEAEGKVGAELANILRTHLVAYVDEVDNGRRTPERGVPCFTSLIGAFNDHPNETHDLDARYGEAAHFAQRIVQGMAASFQSTQRARAAVRTEMKAAVAADRRTLFFAEYLPWKAAYFENGGEDHPTDFVVMPVEGSWRIVAIPPQAGSFAQKVPLPESWAGLVDAALSTVIGVTDARFCHKNRFVAVFATRDGAIEAMRRFGLGGLGGA